MCVLSADDTYTKVLDIHGFGYLLGVLESVPYEYQGRDNCSYAVYGVEKT